MKANELMIGDYVRTIHSQKIVMVREIKQSCIYTEDNAYEYNEIEPIPLTPEILEKNEFKKDAFTNLSPDYYFGNDEYSIYVNLNSTCDKSKSIWIEKRSSRFTVSIEESRHSLEKKPLYVHELQHAFIMCYIDKTIEL